jgi:hypothetical protein
VTRRVKMLRAADSAHHKLLDLADAAAVDSATRADRSMEPVDWVFDRAWNASVRHLGSLRTPASV